MFSVSILKFFLFHFLVTNNIIKGDKMKYLKYFLLLIIFINCSNSSQHIESKFNLPFEKIKRVPENPILSPSRLSWESKDVFNPTSIEVDGKIALLYRAEDSTGIGIWNGTSRIGLAWSDDGIHFIKEETPVLEPSEPYELPGGCEDPRVVRIEGTFYLTYTAYDGKTARLCLASSKAVSYTHLTLPTKA